MIKPRTIHGSLESRTKKDLLALARDLGLTGYSRLKKADLIAFLAAHREPERATPTTTEPKAGGRRIALVTWRCPAGSARDEVTAHVDHLARSLRAEGADVHVFGAEVEAGTASVPFAAHRVPHPGDDEILTQVARIGSRLAESLLEEERTGGTFDVLHVHDWTGAEILTHLTDGRARRVILTLHSVEADRSGGEVWPTSEAIEAREREAAQRVDEVLVKAETVRAFVIQRYGVGSGKVRRIEPPFPVERFAASLEDPGAVKARYAIGPVDPMTLYLGPLDPDHGPDLLLEAIPSILEVEPQARFVFVGDGELADSLRYRTWELGLDGVVRFAGHREGSEVEDLVRAADVMVVPSRGRTSDGPVLCAWSAGRPVVVTEEGPSDGIRHAETGLRARAEPASVAEGVRRILGDWDRARRMGEGGREALRQGRSWEGYSNRVMAVYQDA